MVTKIQNAGLLERAKCEIQNMHARATRSGTTLCGGRNALRSPPGSAGSAALGWRGLKRRGTYFIPIIFR